jgi:hypothetical protein
VYQRGRHCLGLPCHSTPFHILCFGSVNSSFEHIPTTPPTVDTSRLGWATSIFYFGMLAGLYPMTFILQRNQGRIVVHKDLARLRHRPWRHISQPKQEQRDPGQSESLPNDIYSSKVQHSDCPGSRCSCLGCDMCRHGRWYIKTLPG